MSLRYKSIAGVELRLVLVPTCDGHIQVLRGGNLTFFDTLAALRYPILNGTLGVIKSAHTGIGFEFEVDPDVLDFRIVSAREKSSLEQSDIVWTGALGAAWMAHKDGAGRIFVVVLQKRVEVVPRARCLHCDNENGFAVDSDGGGIPPDRSPYIGLELLTQISMVHRCHTE